jgi:hypothetical protein
MSEIRSSDIELLDKMIKNLEEFNVIFAMENLEKQTEKFHSEIFLSTRLIAKLKRYKEVIIRCKSQDVYLRDVLNR